MSWSWEHPALLLLGIPVAVLLAWGSRSSSATSSLPSGHAKLLSLVQLSAVALLLLALASPSLTVSSPKRTLLFVLDRSASMGRRGLELAIESCREMERHLPPHTASGILSAAGSPRIVAYPSEKTSPALRLAPSDQPSTNLESALRMALALLPVAASGDVVLLTDGQETTGDLLSAAWSAAARGIRVHTLPIAGERLPDVRIRHFTTSQPRIHQGATLGLQVSAESSTDGSGLIRLLENGIEIERRSLAFRAGQPVDLEFRRTPPSRNFYSYCARLESGSSADSFPDNDEATALAEVLGPPRVLYVEGVDGQARYLAEAMAAEDIQLEVQIPSALPARPDQLAAFDAVILSDVEAAQFSEATLTAVRSYVEDLGGGLLMIGGPHALGPGGYEGTPLEALLPVELRSRDPEEDPVCALALVIDRSGSMTGEKLQICKSASLATAELLQKDDYIGIYAFDASVHSILPLARVGSRPGIGLDLDLVSAGGGTHIRPAVEAACEALRAVPAKTKHMIVLTDGRTLGQGYEALAASCLAENITISTVAVGDSADVALLQGMAAAGGGKSYITRDPSAITRIFSQDTLLHTRPLVREAPFQAVLRTLHPIVEAWPSRSAPALLGYVRTGRKPSAQVLLSTGGEEDAPLLAHWRYGQGKVTVFTSDCKARWAKLWLKGWDGYSQLWAQVLRETMRPLSGRLLDLRLEPGLDQVRIQADLLTENGARASQIPVAATIFQVISHADSSLLRRVEEQPLRQTGPGLYEAHFRPGESGKYAVRVQAGSHTATAFHIQVRSGETASGQVNGSLLRQVAEITGGQLLTSAGTALPLSQTSSRRPIPLRPVFTVLLIPTLLAGVILRRWGAAMRVARWVATAAPGCRKPC